MLGKEIQLQILKLGDFVSRTAPSFPQYPQLGYLCLENLHLITQMKNMIIYMFK